MKCSNNHYVSGDVCPICEERLFPKKVKVTKINRRSDKRAKQEREYIKLNKEFLEVNMWCAVYPFLRATQVHHKKGRIGKLLTDVRYFLQVSDEGHDEINRRPKWAIEKGYSLSRLENKDTI